MKHFWLFACMFGFAGALFAAPQGPVVTARDDGAIESSDEDGNDGRFYMGAGVGGMRLHRQASPEPGTALRGIQPYVVLRLGYDFADSPWSVEAHGTIGRTRSNQHKSAQNLYGVGVEGLYHFDRYSRFDPFLAAGVSYHSSSNPPTYQDTRRSHYFAQAGIGAFWHFNENLSLRGDVRYHVALADEFISYTSADLSLTYFLGGGEESSVDSLEPVGEIEAGAQAYGATSEHGEKLIDVTPVGSVDEMKLELRIQYAKDTALVQPSEYPALDELVRIIRAAIEANPNVYVTIDGHADRTHGSDHAYNQRLSEARAKSVLTHLSANGVPVEKMKAAGHSFDRPKDPVNLKDGTPSNRRTEIVIRGVDEATREKIRQATK